MPEPVGAVSPHEIRVAALRVLLDAKLLSQPTEANVALAALDALDRAGLLPVAEQSIDNGRSKRWVGAWREVPDGRPHRNRPSGVAGEGKAL